jgi:hypothetical protein
MPARSHKTRFLSSSHPLQNLPAQEPPKNSPRVIRMNTQVGVGENVARMK